MTRRPRRRGVRPFSVERHGGGWRTRVQVGGQRVTIASGCEDEVSAEAAGWKYLNEAAEGTWRDPRRGELPLRTYLDERWWPAQRLALNTKAQYRSLLIHHILPAFGDRQLASIISPEEIAAWEIALHEHPQQAAGRPLSVLSARKANFERMQRLIESRGEDPQRWLPHFMDGEGN